MHDAFISYARADEGWASGLAAELATLHVDTFWDKPGLLAGDPWEPALMKRLQESRNLVVLWSDAARASDWVNREIREFERIQYQGGRTDPDPERRLIFVNLQEPNAAYRRLQSVDLPRDAYQAGPKQFGIVAWRQLAVQVHDAIQAADPLISVPLAIFVMKKKEYASLDRDDESPFGKSFDAVVQALEENGQTRVADCYRDKRTDWSPFGSGKPIMTLLEEILGRVNAAAGPPGYRWHPVDLLDVDPDETRRRISEMFCGGPSVIVVDPLSLYDRTISWRLSLLKTCASNDHALVTVMAPVSTPRGLTVLRDVTRNAASPFIDPYYEPPVPHQPHPVFAINVSDEFDAHRLIRGTLSRYRPGAARSGPDTPTHGFLRTGTLR